MNEPEKTAGAALDPSPQRASVTSVVATLFAAGFLAPCVWPRHGLIHDVRARPLMIVLFVIASGVSVLGVRSASGAMRGTGSTKAVAGLSALVCVAVLATPVVVAVYWAVAVVGHLFTG